MNNHLKHVARYLDSLAFRKADREDGRPWGTGPFVTISRQAGAGGHALAEALIKELSGSRKDSASDDWQLFNQTLLSLMSKEPGLDESLHSILNEEYYSKGHDYIRQVLGGRPPQDVVLRRIFGLIRSLAGAGKVIIVGRAGVCLTRDMPGGVHIRLVAERESRLAALGRQLCIDRAAAVKKLRDLESARANLARTHFGRDIEDATLYDCVWNTDRVETAAIARWIAGRIEEKVQASQRAASSA